MLIDLHVHSTVSSCSKLSPHEIISTAKARGLDGVCITDHGSTAVLSQIVEGFQSDGLLIIVGMEYSTPQGDFLVFGDVEALALGMQAPELLAAVTELGGAIVAAHPFRGWRPVDIALFERFRCSAIEVLNGRNAEFENDLAAGLARKFNMPAVAGSDAHTLSELAQFATQFSVPITDRADLVRAINMGQCTPVAVSPKKGVRRRVIAAESNRTLLFERPQCPWRP